MAQRAAEAAAEAGFRSGLLAPQCAAATWRGAPPARPGTVGTRLLLKIGKRVVVVGVNGRHPRRRPLLVAAAAAAVAAQRDDTQLEGPAGMRCRHVAEKGGQTGAAGLQHSHDALGPAA